MRFFFRLISRLFALMTVLYLLLYAYGAYLAKNAEEKEQALEAEIKSGNGFGGEVGMKIIDSEFRTREYFWIDDDHLLFKIKRPTPINDNHRDNYIWNVATGEVLPLEIDGSASCIRGGYLYFIQALNPNRSSSDQRTAEIYRSQLKRKSDRWTVDSELNINAVWPDVPDRYKYNWRDGHECKPKYYLPRETRLASEIPDHYIVYLSHWGWIFRRPRDGNPNNKPSRIGFFEIGDSVYAGQDGQWKADSPEISDLRDFSLTYVNFLDKYWIANRLNLDFGKSIYLGLIDRSGRISSIAWSNDWPFYDAVPLPTRKGIFLDSRNPGKGINNSGGYLLDAKNNVHKVVHGAVEYLQVSPDGCRVAFYHRPKDSGADKSQLRVFDTCKSSIQGREMTNVQYRNITD